MEFHADASLRIVVSGIMKRKTTIQDDLRCVLQEAGCNVAAVRLVMDSKRRGKNRGFSFVDFADHDSLKRALALTLESEQVRGLAEKDGTLRIEQAGLHESADQPTKRKHEEQTFAVHVATLNAFLQDQKAKVQITKTFVDVVEESPPLLRRQTAA